MAGDDWKEVPIDHKNAIPFFLDLHINGFAGSDLLNFQHPSEISKIGRALFASGVGAYQPSLISAPLDQLLPAISLIDSARREQADDEAEILGIHLEGPFLNPTMRGAHRLESLQRPDLDLLRRLISSGTVTMITIAPELPGSLELIRFASSMGIHVSLGHSDADADIARRAFAAGADSVTHIFNRCSYDLATVALEESDCSIQFIADGSHIDENKILQIIEKASDRMIAVTDGTSFAGISLHEANQETKFGDQRVILRDGAAFLEDGTKAGSIATMRECFERVHGLSGNRELARRATIDNPADFMGRGDLASLECGRPAQAFTT